MKSRIKPLIVVTATLDLRTHNCIALPNDLHQIIDIRAENDQTLVSITYLTLQSDTDWAASTDTEKLTKNLVRFVDGSVVVYTDESFVGMAAFPDGRRYYAFINS